jgi:serine/threonine protein kinase
MSGDITGQVILNRYRVDAFIEAGGMGAVYRIWDLARNVPLAMKVLHEDLKDDPSVWKMFQREAEALKKLAHPHIVPFYGLFETPAFAFFLEHYVDGYSLKHILHTRKGSPMSISEALIILKTLCASLGYAHINGIIHCDIKPGNVLIDKSGSVFLTDFGIARHALSTTTTMASAGTPAYMAPEQIGGEPVTPATDVYALGILLFEMLTGRRPFLGSEPESEDYGPSTDQRIYYAQLSLMPTNPARINPQVPDALGRVVLKAMQKEPAQRYSSTAEMLLAACQAAGFDSNRLPDHLGQNTPGMQPAQPVYQPPNMPATIYSSATPSDYPVNQPAPVISQSRRKWPVILAAGIGVACLALVALAVLGAVLWKGYNTAVSGTQITRTAAVEPGTTLSLTREASSPTQPAATATSNQNTAPLSPTITRAAPTPARPTLTPTEDTAGFLAPPYQPIPGCASSHIHLKDWVLITYGGGRNSLRSTPDTHPKDNKIGVIEPGELIYVIEGPVCNYGWLLWKVKTATGLEGWTPETDGKGFFLEPFPSWEACPNSPRSLLHKDDQAQVTLYPPQANRVRSDPGLSGTRIGSIDPGKKVAILDGPRCADGYVWWQVRSEDGLTGWTAEAEKDTYFLVPVPKQHY